MNHIVQVLIYSQYTILGNSSGEVAVVDAMSGLAIMSKEKKAETPDSAVSDAALVLNSAGLITQKDWTINFQWSMSLKHKTFSIEHIWSP